jgi:hypothetical protein
MAEKLDPKEIVTLEELALSSMLELAALVEVPEHRGGIVGWAARWAGSPAGINRAERATRR